MSRLFILFALTLSLNAGAQHIDLFRKSLLYPFTGRMRTVEEYSYLSAVMELRFTVDSNPRSIQRVNMTASNLKSLLAEDPESNRLYGHHRTLVIASGGLALFGSAVFARAVLAPPPFTGPVVYSQLFGLEMPLQTRNSYLIAGTSYVIAAIAGHCSKALLIKSVKVYNQRLTLGFDAVPGGTAQLKLLKRF